MDKHINFDPDPFLLFDEETHRYYDLKKKRYVPVSVTGIISDDTALNRMLNGEFGVAKQCQIQEAINRGKSVHKAVEYYFKTGQILDIDPYNEWLKSFLEYPNFDGIECIVSEFLMVDRRYDIAGTLDFLLKNRNTNELYLCDIKTKNPGYVKQKAKTMTQLGGYLSLLYCNKPEVEIKQCRIYYVTNKETRQEIYDPISCLELFEVARKKYHDKQLPF